MKNLFFFFLFMLLYNMSIAQLCSITIHGAIQDNNSKAKLSGASITIQGIGKSIVAGNGGSYKIENLCPGSYTVSITHIGYDTLNSVINLDSSIEQNFLLQHTSIELQQVNITARQERKDQISTLAKSEIKGIQLFQTSGNTLGESLKSIPGLNSLQTGPSLSKPVIHGMHSNRLLILNNGVRQEGQQWGSEHAPEIDPFIASTITIIKGAASVRYGSDAIVGVILLEPKTLAPENNFGGEVNLVAGSNGNMGVVSGMLEGKRDKGLKGFSWRGQGTLKRTGNFKTSKYYLKNSGLSEGDFSLAANYKKNNYGAEIYFSEFNNRIGIFEGSHVGNITDLYAAFARPVPITASYFTYDIDRTYQKVKHGLLKASAYYDFNNHGKLQVFYAIQQNKRDEYDIDLPFATDPEILKAPQISFKITTTTLDLLYNEPVKNNFSGSIGVSGVTQANVFHGIRYLVPNFRNYGSGLFAIEKYTKNKLTLETGLRYDYRWQRVYQLNNTTLQTFHTTRDYSNVTATAGATYKFNNKFSINANAGTAWRAPSINELYIDGIHLSAASYEKGDSNLASERSYNFTFSLKYDTEKFSAEAVTYNNAINNFIYAKPTLQPITLISGTYPYFVYTQADVDLKGLDIDLDYKPFKHISVESKTSVIRAWNKTIHDCLIFMPADRFDNQIKYSVDKWRSLADLYFSLQNITVTKQTRVPPNSDYVNPPAGYSLLNANIGFATKLGKKPLTIDLGAYNFTNVAYRDYLNRFRYYADDLGINIVLRTKLIF